MAAPDPWSVYDNWMHEMDGNLIDLSSDTIKVALFDSSFTPAPDTGTAYSTTDELSTEFGYTQGGQTCTGVSWTEDSTGVFTLDVTVPAWTAAGGSITARYAVAYDSTATGTPIIATCLLDSAPADVTATTGNTFTINTASGLYTTTRS